VRTRNTYSTEEIERVLWKVAELNDSPTRAAIALNAEGGKTFRKSTIREWKENTHAERFQEIRAEFRKSIESKTQAKLAADYEDAAIDSLASIRETIRRFNEVSEKVNLENPTAQDLRAVAGAAKELATVAGIAGQNARTERGRPTEIYEYRDSDEILNTIAKRHPGLIVEGSAEEITDAELVPPAGDLPEAA
jgi:membrane-bound lytic murein transglycosylase